MEATNYFENLPYCEKKDKGKREQEELWFLLRRKKKQKRIRSASEERKIREKIESKNAHTNTFP
jgi:hypothetical protein